MVSNVTPIRKPSFDVAVPWRSFKAFVQLYDYTQRFGKDIVERPQHRGGLELLVLSEARAGEKTRAPLLSHGLIEVADTYIRYNRGIPCGREDAHPLHEGNTPSLIVSPVARSAAGGAWVRTQGRCAYCAQPLRFSHLALGADSESAGARLIACKRCHATRGPRSLEDFRFMMAMKRFQEKNGVRFSREQVEYLRGVGFELDIPKYEFWFERCMSN